MPIDRDTHLIAELSPLQIGAVATVATTMTVPAVIQHLIGDLSLLAGRSMSPTFPKRCIVKYKAVPFEQLKIGDIPVVLLTQNYLIKFSHQLQQTDKDYITLQNKIYQFLGIPPNPKQAWVHRIIQKTNNGFVTKGDGNRDPDPQLCTKDTYVGRILEKMVLDLSGPITGPLLESLFSLLKHYKPII